MTVIQNGLLPVARSVVLFTWVLLTHLTLTDLAFCQVALVVEDVAPGTPHGIVLRSNGQDSAEVQLNILNQGDAPVDVSFAQAALTIVPQGGASGSLLLDAAIAQAPLFSGAFEPDIAAADDSVITPQHGEGFIEGTLILLSATLGPGERGGLASLHLLPEMGAAGDYQLVALGFNATEVLRSTQLTPAASPPLLFPQPEAFSNIGLEQTVLATIEVVPVPEPASASLAMTAALGLLAGCRCRRPSQRKHR